MEIRLIMKNILAPIAGTIIGLSLVIWSITSAGTFSAFVDLPALVITLFGSMAAVFTSVPLADFLTVPRIIKNLFAEGDSRVEMVNTIADFSRRARINGILSIEEDVQAQDNELLVTGLQMVIDGKDGDSILEFIELQMTSIEEEYSLAPTIFGRWGEYAPAFGMTGTLVGLIIMLGELDDPTTIGSGMATALITTLYGTILANLIFLPLASNLSGLADEKLQINEIILEGILSIQEGQNPRDIEDKLSTYLTDAELKEYNSTSSVDSLDRGKQEG